MFTRSRLPFQQRFQGRKDLLILLGCPVSCERHAELRFTDREAGLDGNFRAKAIIRADLIKPEVDHGFSDVFAERVYFLGCHMSNIPKVAGVVWYKDEETYMKALSIFEDGDSLPRTYQEFILCHAYATQEAEERGFVALKAEIDPDAFLAWCGSHNIQPDRNARMAFADEVAADYLRSKGFM